MANQLLNSKDAAAALGVSALTLYDWLARSDRGEFKLRGQPFTINYLQGGAWGQGRIQIEAPEIERLKDAMRVRPQAQPRRREPARPQSYPGITVALGRPAE